MMLSTKPFSKRAPSSQYILDVAPLTTKKVAKKAKVTGGYSLSKKILLSLLMVVTVLFGSGTAAVAATASTDTANASNLLNPPSWLCPYKDNALAYLDGVSDTVTRGANGDTKNPAVNSGFNITIVSQEAENPYVTSANKPASGQAWTALEQYGYFAPNFENWTGLYFEDGEYGGEWPFVGTGGQGNGKYGSIVGIDNAAQSALLSKDVMADCLGGSFGAGFNVGMANWLLDVSSFFTMLSGETYGFAINTDITHETSPLHGLATGIEDMITGGDHPENGLRQVLFLDWLVGIIFVATLWLIWTGIVKRRALQTGQGVLWMIGASVAGALLLANPLFIPTQIDTITANVNAAVSSAIIPAASGGTEMCNVPANTSASDASIRKVKCSIWYMNVYVPWVKGQFGVDVYNLATTDWMNSDGYTTTRDGATSSAKAWSKGDLKGDGFKTVDSSPASASELQGSRGVFDNANIKYGDVAYSGKMNWAVYMLDRQNNWKSTSTFDYSEIAFNQLVVNQNTIWKDGDGRGAGAMSILGAVGPTSLLLAMSLLLIGMQLSMLFLIALAPVFLLAGVAPGWGRRISMRWLELLTGLLVKRIILSIFMILFLKIYFLIIQSNIDWWMQVIIALVLSVVVWTQREKITGIFNNAINFGGDKRFDDGQGIMQATKQQVASRTGNAIRRTGKAASAIATARGNKQTAGGRARPQAGAQPSSGTSAKNTPTATQNPATGSPSARRAHREAEAQAKAAEAQAKVDDRNARGEAKAAQRFDQQKAKDEQRVLQGRKAKRSVEVRERQIHDGLTTQINRRKEIDQKSRDAKEKFEQGLYSKKEYLHETRTLAAQRASSRRETDKLKKAALKDPAKIEARNERTRVFSQMQVAAGDAYDSAKSKTSNAKSATLSGAKAAPNVVKETARKAKDSVIGAGYNATERVKDASRSSYNNAKWVAQDAKETTKKFNPRKPKNN